MELNEQILREKEELKKIQQSVKSESTNLKSTQASSLQ